LKSHRVAETQRKYGRVLELELEQEIRPGKLSQGLEHESKIEYCAIPFP